MGDGGSPSWSLARRGGVIVVGLVLGTAAVTVSLVLSGGTGPNRLPGRALPEVRGPARPSPSASSRPIIGLLSQAVDVTTASGSFDTTDVSMTSSPSCPTGSVAADGGQPGCRPTLPVTTSHTVVNTHPFAMMAVSDDGPLGVISLYDNGTDVWEVGGGGYGAGAGGTGPGAPLSGFAGSVEGTLGQEAGALQMQSVAGGAADLDFETQEIQGAAPDGTGNVDGVPVTTYKLFTTGLEDPDLPGLTPEEVTTRQQADEILQAAGFKGKTTWLSVDADGYIREQVTIYTLADGTTVTNQSVYSNFGCAGTVLMPDQSGDSAPPAGCVSPDQAGSGTPVTNPPPTTTPPSWIPSTSLPSATSSTPTTIEIPAAPSAPTTSTTSPGSGPITN